LLWASPLTDCKYRAIFNMMQKYFTFLFLLMLKGIRIRLKYRLFNPNTYFRPIK